MVIEDNTFTNIDTWTDAQYADGSADAIYVHGSETGTVTIQRNIITGVSSSDPRNAGDGIGITVLDLDFITISGNNISDTWHNSINIYQNIAGYVHLIDNTLSNWDSNQDDGHTDITTPPTPDDTQIPDCGGGRALRIDLEGGASITIIGNTFEPNDNPNPVDPNYVKITNCNTNIATLKSEIKDYNIWPDGVDYSAVLTVN